MKRILYLPKDEDKDKLIRINDLSLAEFYFYRNYVPTPDAYYDILLKDIPWTQGQVSVAGKIYDERRMTCMFSLDNEKTYKYSGKTNKLLEFPPLLEIIRADVSRIVFGDTGRKFNTCLCNYYRDGNDKISMHSDSEASLVKNSPIASISLGAVRHFDIDYKEKKKNERNFRIDLANGSLLIMGHDSQK